MIKFIKENKKKFRFYIFLFLVIVSYFFSIFYLFGANDVLASIVGIFFLFIFFHFLSLDSKGLKFFNVILITFFLTLFDIILFLIFNWDINTWLVISIFLFNSSFSALFYSLDFVQFNSLSYFTRGGYIFTFFITITYSFALIGMFRQFPFTCEGLREASNKLVEFVEKPFMLPAKKLSIGEDILKDQKNDIQTQIVDQKIENVVLGVKDVEILVDSGSIFYPIVGKINLWKTNTVDQIIADQENYSDSMCDILLTEINEKYRVKQFGVSAIMLTYFLLFGFIRLAFFIMSFIGFLLFKLLYFFGLYKINKIKKEVYEIK